VILEAKMASGFTNPWATQTITQGFFGNPSASQVGVEFSYLIDAINFLTTEVKSKIAIIRSKRSAMSIADMFDLQMLMNKLSQFSEMSTSIITAMNTSIMSMARNMKG
jgi:hypothetical protein